MVPGEVRPVEELADLIGDARFVLLGEATHGTHEFYAVRAELTRRLIADHGFGGVAVEADWPEADRVDRYVRRAGADPGPAAALAGFRRFPPWLWRNPVVAELVAWLREHGRGAGFHGLDLRRLREAMSPVVDHAGAADPPATRDRRRSDAWNLRDVHMADRLDALHAHTGGGRIVAWAHNSHVGDARATEAAARGELSLGQLMRERHGDAVRLVGFTTHAGTVTAAREWGGPAERRVLRPSLDGSLERLLHDTGVQAGLLDLRRGALAGRRLSQRMVGVVYRPEAELWCHYLSAHPADQFDALVHLDETTALEPLEPWAATEEPAATDPARR